MEKETDLRVARTRQLLKEAFMELLGTIGFEKITVANLVQKAGVNRSTFYLHYTDKFDLLAALEAEIMIGMRAILMSVDFDAVFNFTYEGKPMEHILRILNYVKAHEQFYKLMLGPKGDPAFLGKIGEFIRSMLSEIMVRYGFLDKLLIPANYVFSMFVAIITSFLNEWVRTDMKEPPFDLACMMTRVVENIPRGIINLSADGA